LGIFVEILCLVFIHYISLRGALVVDDGRTSFVWSVFKGGNNLRTLAAIFVTEKWRVYAEGLIARHFFQIKIKNSIFCLWQFVERLRSRKVNIYEVKSVISIHDISFMILTVLIEGGTTWDWKCIHILMVGLCWLYIKLFTHFFRLWGRKISICSF
jgi:hypothetical protein